MRLITENVESYLDSLAQAIQRDPASFSGWQGLHLHPKDPHLLATDADALYQCSVDILKEVHSTVDCDILRCPDGDIFMISRDIESDALWHLALDVLARNHGHADGDPMIGIQLYHLFDDHAALVSLLRQKTGSTDLKSPSLLRALPPFSGLEGFEDVFLEALGQRPARRPLQVMVVDDDPLTRRIVANVLKRDYAIIAARDAQEAMTHYLMYAPDLVLLDINLPYGSGIAVLDRLMLIDPEAFIVMFSGNNYLDNITSALTAGARGFMGKPFCPETLRGYLERAALHHHKEECLPE